MHQQSIISLFQKQNQSQQSIFFKVKYFQAFYYHYKLAMDCKRRIEKILKSNDIGDAMTEDVFIKIGIVGAFTDADLKLVSKGRGNIISIVKCELKVYFDFYCISFL